MDEHHRNKIAEAFREPETLEQLGSVMSARLFEKWALAPSQEAREELHATFRAARELIPLLREIAEEDIYESANE